MNPIDKYDDFIYDIFEYFADKLIPNIASGVTSEWDYALKPSNEESGILGLNLNSNNDVIIFSHTIFNAAESSNGLATFESIAIQELLYRIFYTKAYTMHGDNKFNTYLSTINTIDYCVHHLDELNKFNVRSMDLAEYMNLFKTAKLNGIYGSNKFIINWTDYYLAFFETLFHTDKHNAILYRNIISKDIRDVILHFCDGNSDKNIISISLKFNFAYMNCIALSNFIRALFKTYPKLTASYKIKNTTKETIKGKEISTVHIYINARLN